MVWSVSAACGFFGGAFEGGGDYANGLLIKDTETLRQ